LHLDHFFRDLLWSVVAVFPIYLLGYIIESDGRRIDGIPSRKELLLNSAHVLVFYAADLSVGVMTIYYLKVFLTGFCTTRPLFTFTAGSSRF